MVRKIATYITDKRIFAGFYVLTITYNFLLIRLVLPDFYVWIRSEGFPVLYIMWAFIIVIYDFLKGKLFDNTVKIIWNFMFIIALLSMVFQPKPRSIQQIRYLIVFGIQVYILLSATVDSGRDKMFKLVKSLSIQLVVIVSILNTISLIIACCLLLKVNLPEWIINLNNGLLPTPSNHMTTVLPESFGRYKGLFLSEPEAGFVCYLAITLNLFLLDCKRISRSFCIFNIICCLLMILLTEARDVFINVGIIMLATTFFYMEKRNGRKKALAYTLFFAFIMIAVISYRIIGLIMESDIADSTQLYEFLNKYSSRRLLFYNIGWNDFLKNKFLGNGWLNCDALRPYSPASETHPNYHNCIINLLAWTGVLGTGWFLFALNYSWHKINKNRMIINENHCKWLIVLCVCVLMQSLLDICLFGEDTHIETVFFWICFGHLIYMNTSFCKTNGIV